MPGLFKKTPWWAFFLLAGSVYVMLVFLSAIFSIHIKIQGFYINLPVITALSCLVPLGVFSWLARRKGSLLANQEMIRHLNDLEWKTYHEKIKHCFHTMGYTVISGPDHLSHPPFLVKLIKDGDLTLVMLKREKRTYTNRLRELIDHMVTEGVENGLVISTGLFSGPARRYAKNAPVELLDGVRLMILLGRQPASLADEPLANPSPKEISQWVQVSQPKCPLCFSTMNLSLGKTKGALGKTFWKCSCHPGCQGRHVYHVCALDPNELNRN